MPDIKTDFRIDRGISKYLWIILFLLFIDQLIKIIAFKAFVPHEELKIIGNWFRIRLELNDGTAFSNLFVNEKERYIKIGTKILLSVILIICLIYYQNKRSPKILINGLALCVAGMTGNLIDRVFHGVLLNNSINIYSTKWFHGQIIDMFYFPIFETKLPNWFPFHGGENYLFFWPVFNLADLILFIGGVFAFVGLIKISRLSQIKN
jgi:signal peptidase II